jgi:hypothetical protein
MNILFRLLITLLTTISFLSCASTQEKPKASNQYILTEKTPFMITEGHFQKWAAGAQGGGSGTHVFLTFAALQKNVSLKELYFKGEKTSLKIVGKNSNKYQASFRDQNRTITIMDHDALKEAVNTPPVKIPFTLKEDDAVLSYIENNELKFFKISALPEKPLIAYPSSNRNNKQ